MDTLQHALNRAVERRNMALFTPVGQARELAAVTLRLAVEAITDGDTTLAAAILDQAQPESPDNSAATVVRLHRRCPRPARPLAVRARPERPAGPGQANPATRRALDRRTRRHRHPRPGPQTTGLPLARHPDHQARRPARPLRQRPRPRRRRPDLVTTRRHPTHRPRPHRHPLNRYHPSHQ